MAVHARPEAGEPLHERAGRHEIFFGLSGQAEHEVDRGREACLGGEAHGADHVVDAMTKWIHGWRKKSWVTSSGSPVLNRDLIEALDARSRELDVRYRWVRGHDGHAVNEIVDQLAQGAARGAGKPERAAVVAALRSLGLLR